MKKLVSIAILFVLSLSTGNLLAQDKTYQLSSHILDITAGQPASNVDISLYKQDKDGVWKLLDQKTTDSNGRVKSFLENKNGLSNLGIYKLKFETLPYFTRQEKETFYPFIEVIFEIKDDNHYHVPITLSPFGYSTYRGN